MPAIAPGTIAIWVALAITGVGVAIARSQLNEVLRLFAELEPQAWREAGQPSGLFGLPRGRRFLVDDPSVGWLGRPPEWVADSPEAQRRLAAARVGIAIAMGGLLILAGAIWWQS